MFNFSFEVFQNLRVESDLKYHLIQFIYFINEKLPPQQGNHRSEITVSTRPQGPVQCLFHCIRLTVQKTEKQMPRNKSQIFINKKSEIHDSLSFALLFIPLFIWTFAK